MNNPNSIEPPRYVDGAYPCHSIGKMVDRELIPELTPTERRTAQAEICQAVTGLSMQLDNAKKEAAEGIAEYPVTWARKAAYMKDNLYELILLLRDYEKERPKTLIELEAQRRANKLRRRFRRQRFQIDAFIQLVSEELGDDVCMALLIESGHIANSLAESEGAVELPDNPFSGE